MKKFLIVGCGGSGGTTLHYIMDQLRADLRKYGVTELPAAWQFLHIDVPPDPQTTGGIGDIRGLGGTYRSVSAPGNTYGLVATQVEQSMTASGGLRSMLGWEPFPREDAEGVSITDGAGQYRAVGRMLTLTSLTDLQATLNKIGAAQKAPTAWGDLPTKYPQGGPYPPDSGVIPILVASMAGGSGASMFLDVARMLGRVPGVNRGNLGVFLYTADVFSSLERMDRVGVDGNALGALGEIIAAQTRASDEYDAELFSARGITREPQDNPAFARIFPIGIKIGGQGATFGDGTPSGVFRGLGRGLAAVMLTEESAEQYRRTKFENPAAEFNRDMLGWSANKNTFAWASLGYASLSLGRDRYAEYAAQRLARSSFDQAQFGYKVPEAQTSEADQLRMLLDSQFPEILRKLNLPPMGGNLRNWFTQQLLNPDHFQSEAMRAAEGAIADLNNTEGAAAPRWFAAMREKLDGHQSGAASKIQSGAYQFTENWAIDLERRMGIEFVEAVTVGGVPYAVEMVRRLKAHLEPSVERLKGLSSSQSPLEFSQEALGGLAQLGNTVVNAGHTLAAVMTRGYIDSAKIAVEGTTGQLVAKVLAAFNQDVLTALENAAEEAVRELAHYAGQNLQQAGLAQLATEVYKEWPTDDDAIPPRFNHAENEVLLTTAAEFPAQYRADVQNSAGDGGEYKPTRNAIVAEVLRGRWVAEGGVKADFKVLANPVPWWPGCLPTKAGVSTSRSVPAYKLKLAPADILERARAFMERPDKEFKKFSGETIKMYLKAEGSSDEERERRSMEFSERFLQAMQLAQPLVGVHDGMVQATGVSEGVKYEYTFGEIPLGDCEDARKRIIDGLNLRAATLSGKTLENFEKAVKVDNREDRIAIFGGYPRYSPLVFNSLMGQIQARWADADQEAREGLWQWKRTRPLRAALAMAENEQRAMIEGWFLGRLVGSVVKPDTLYSEEPAQVHREKDGGWYAFPNPLLTPAHRFRHGDDWLPAVLESYSLAIVLSNEDVTMRSLKPYWALRELSDATTGSAVTFGETSGDRLLVKWLLTGAGPSGQPSQVASLSNVTGFTIEARHEAAAAWLEINRKHIGDKYLTAEGGIGALSVRVPRVEKIADLASAPMFTEIADLALDVITKLQGRLEIALAKAKADSVVPAPTMAPAVPVQERVIDESPF